MAPLSAAALETFLDDLFAHRMQHSNLYGAAFVLVQGGKTLLAKGYGQADPISRVPLDANETVISVASIAKALTATAAMQLWERGLVDPDADIQQYLPGFRFAGDCAEPVTLRHLLTHTEGLQERNIGIVATDPKDLLSLHDFFATRPVRRVLPPGTAITYGNYASGLLGYLVEEVSGLSFEQYLQENIFGPLGMTSSTFAQPPRPDLAARRLRECVRKGETYVEAPAVYAQMAPAGGMHASAADMARFLIAMVGDGSCNGQRILQAETVKSMHERRFAPHPQMPGITYGFFEEWRGARRVLRRDGDSAAAWSRIYLLPEEEIGLFFTVAGDEEARLELADAFFEHFFPTEAAAAAHASAPASPALAPAPAAPAPAPTPAPSAAPDLRQYEGTYRYLQHNRDSFTKLQSLLVGQVRVKAQPNGTLTVTALNAGDVYGGFEGTTTWAPAGEHFFRRQDGNGQIAFDGQGHLYSSLRYQGAFQRLRWWETAPVHMALFGLGLLASLGALCFLFVGGGVAGLVTGLYGLLATAFCVLLVPALFLIGNVGGGFPAYGFGINGWIRGVLTLPLLTPPLSAALVAATTAAWATGLWSPGLRLLHSAIALVAGALVWWLRYYNLIGYRW